MLWKLFEKNYVPMDNTDILLDLIEHPENYSEQEVQKIFADPRSRDLYKFLSYAA